MTGHPPGFLAGMEYARKRFMEVHGTDQLPPLPQHRPTLLGDPLERRGILRRLVGAFAGAVRR
jgi:hypothetical protein